MVLQAQQRQASTSPLRLFYYNKIVDSKQATNKAWRSDARAVSFYMPHVPVQGTSQVIISVRFAEGTTNVCYIAIVNLNF
jgi:hypothetical protein